MSKTSHPLIAWYIPEPRFGWFYRLSGRQLWHPDLALASVWIRGFQVGPYLTEKNYKITVNQDNPLPDVAIFLRRYDRQDVALARKLKSQGVKIILDVIVNYFEARADLPFGYGGATQELVSNFLRLVDLADQVWTVSPFLQELASNHHPNSHFISDSVDPKHFRRATSKERISDGPVILGWSGKASKAHTLDHIAATLQPLISTGQVKLKLITQKRPEINLEYLFVPWRYDSLPDEIASCDLCLAPREANNNYDRGHSLFKIGLFMAMGVPALAGPVPSYELLLGDGQAGAICNSENNWRQDLMRYINHEEIRRAAGIKAIEKTQPYLTPVVSDQIDMLLKNLLQ